MIKPHGADALNPLLVTDAAERDQLIAEAATLPSLLLTSAAAANAVMLGSLLAGLEESPGEIVLYEGRRFKLKMDFPGNEER